MPQTRQPPYNDEVQDLPGQSAPVAAQRNIHIFPEPGTQRNMPPPPVFGNAAAQVRVIKVFQELKAQHFSQPNGHIGVTGKVEVNLEGKRNGSQPGRPGGKAGSRQRRDGIPQGAHLVGNQHFFAQTNGKSANACGKLRCGFPAMRKLLFHRFILHNGAGNQLREQRNVGAEGDGVFLRRHSPPVHINDITQRLEGVKADADGQGQLQQRYLAAGHMVYGANQQIGVFKEAQRPDIPSNTENKQRFGQTLFLPLLQGGYPQPAQVVEQNGSHHQPDINRLAPGIEQQADHQQPQVAQRPRAQVIYPHHQGEKQE